MPTPVRLADVVAALGGELCGGDGGAAERAITRLAPLESADAGSLSFLSNPRYGAQLAAYLGLPYAFASHFAPAMLDEARETYRATFRPSEWLETPYFMLAAGVCAADTEAEAEYLRSSQRLAFARLRSGAPGKLPAPRHDLSEIPPRMLAEVDHALSCAAVGSPDTVKAQLAALIARHQPDEIMLTGMIHDHAARLRSFRIAAEAMAAV